MEKEDKIYHDHIDNLRIKVPVGMEQSVSSFISKKEAYRKRFILGVSSAAAVLLILISTILVLPNRSQQMDYGEKLATIVEAYKLFPENENSNLEEVIYEDELIVIYLK